MVAAVLSGVLPVVIGPPPSPPPASSSPEPPAATTCALSADAKAVIQPDPAAVGSLRFCPTRINDGGFQSPGPFEVDGQVLGPLTDRRQVLLINYLDPRTCDAYGNQSAKGAYLLSSVNIGSSDGRWSYVEQLGYPEAVTIARTFKFVTASPKSLQTIRNDRVAWAFCRCLVMSKQHTLVRWVESKTSRATASKVFAPGPPRSTHVG